MSGRAAAAEALQAYRDVLGLSADAFAALCDAPAAMIEAALAGAAEMTPDLARRIVAASGGAVDFADLMEAEPGALADFASAKSRAGSALDPELLSAAIAVVVNLPDPGDGETSLADVAAEAAINTEAALVSINAGSGDLLPLILRPVIEEILEATGGGRDRPLADRYARKAAALYREARRRVLAPRPGAPRGAT